MGDGTVRVIGRAERRPSSVEKLKDEEETRRITAPICDSSFFFLTSGVYQEAFLADYHSSILLPVLRHSFPPVLCTVDMFNLR